MSSNANYDIAVTRDAIFRQRVQDVLLALQAQFPSLAIVIDAWRPYVVSEDTGAFGDEQDETWVRLGEGIDAFLLEKNERWFQAEVGVINQRVSYLLLPQLYGLRADDHVIVNGLAYLIIESVEQMGISKLKIDRTKQRFQPQNIPGRFAPTYRMLEIKASIQ